MPKQLLMDDIDRDEALLRMPELTDIKDDELREQMIPVVMDLPGYFWVAPAASSHHPVEHRKRHGLWLHVKRVCTVFERFAPSMTNQGHLSWQDVDRGRAACILHDMFKHGMPVTEVNQTVKDHDVIAANWLEDHTELHEDIIGAVAAHNGPWYEGPPPRSHLEQVVHMADMVGSDPNVDVAVKDPHSVLTDQFPRVRVRGDHD